MKINLNYFYVVIGQGSNYLFPLIIYPLLNSKFGLDIFGFFSLYIVVSQLFLLIVDYGFGYSLVSRLVEANKLEESYFFYNVLGAKILIFCVIFIVSFLLLFLLNYELIVVLLISLLSCFFSIFNPFWYFQATSDFKTLALISIFSKIITMFMMWLFVGYDNIYLMMFIFSLQYFFISLIGFFYLKSRGFLVGKVKFEESFNILKKSSNYFFSNFSTSIYTVFTPIILGLSAAKVEIATYNAVTVIKQGLAGMAAPVIQVMYSKMIFDKVVSLPVVDFHKYIIKRIFLMIVFVGFFSIIVVFFSDSFSRYMFGFVSLELKLSIMMTSLTAIVIVFNSAFSTFCLLALGMTKQLFSSVRLAAFLCLLLAYPVSIFWGASGIIMLLLVVEILVGLLMLYFYNNPNPA